MKLSQKTINTLLLSCGFFCIFASFNPTQSLQTIVIQDAASQTNGTLAANGYVSLTIVYLTMGTTQWVAPVLVNVMKSRVGLAVASLAYIIYTANFLWLTTWSLYLASALLGVGAAVLWTSRAAYAGKNSSSDTATRDSGIFMTFFSFSAVFSSLFSFFVLRGKKTITEGVRTTLFLCFTSVGVVGLVFFATLPSPKGRVLCSRLCRKRGEVNKTNEEAEERTEDRISPLQQFIRTLKFAISPIAFLILPVAWNSGLANALLSVYATSIGNSESLGSDSTSGAGLAVIFVALGRSTASLFIFAIGKTVYRNQRHFVVIFGCAVTVIALMAAMLTTAPLSPFQRTKAEGILPSNLSIAMLLNFLIGFGVMCADSEFFAIVMDFMNTNEHTTVIALFTFYQSMSSGITFFYSLKLALYWQLLIALTVACSCGISYTLLQWKLVAGREKEKELYDDATPGLMADSRELKETEKFP